MLNHEWTIVAGVVLLPVLGMLALEGAAFTQRRRERARAHRSKQPVRAPRS